MVSQNCQKPNSRFLITHGAKVNKTDQWGSTALHFASSCGFNEVVEALISGGADISIKNRVNIDFAILDLQCSSECCRVVPTS